MMRKRLPQEEEDLCGGLLQILDRFVPVFLIPWLFQGHCLLLLKVSYRYNGKTQGT